MKKLNQPFLRTDTYTNFITDSTEKEFFQKLVFFCTYYVINNRVRARVA